MPEVLTKHPSVVIDVLESGGARCGDGLPQKILTACPRDAFCALPRGEMCVYGLDDLDAMTQIDSADLAPLVCTQSAAPPMATTGGCAASGPEFGAALIGAMMLGLLLGRRLRRVPVDTA